MSIKKLDLFAPGIVSGFPFTHNFGKETDFSRISAGRSLSEEQLWMRSVCDSGALTGRHSTRVGTSLSRQWVLRSASSTFWSYGCCCTTTSRVDMKDRQGRRKIHWNGHLTSSFDRRRNLGSSRRKMVKVRIAGGGWALPTLDYNMPQSREQALLTNEGPSCIFVGPLEKAAKASLEALYQQARDSYYSGSPLIVDDMFDRVETRLRWHGSKLVLKYPRCSLKRFSAYADAELDSSQMMALASIWSVLLATGLVAAALAPACAINKACQKSIHVHFDSHEATFITEAMMTLNGALAVGMGLLIGIPVAVAAARSLQGLWRGDLVALKGCCPNCGEEVYAFVRADQPNQPQHKTECHVCEHPLGFRAHVERSAEDPGKLWAYGRVYLLTQSKDLVPSKGSSS